VFATVVVTVGALAVVLAVSLAWPFELLTGFAWFAAST
jgi:hypothetical protein